MVPSARYGSLLCRALGVGEGDEVIIPALTYYAIPLMAPTLTGAKVVLADIGLNHMYLIQTLSRRLSQSVRKQLYQPICLEHLVIWGGLMRLRKSTV